MSPRPERWKRYLAEVCRFDTLALLALTAQESCALLASEAAAPDPGAAWTGDGVVPPFAVAAIARDAILSGPIRGGEQPRRVDLLRLCHRYLNLEEPALTHPTTPIGHIDRYLVRVAYEQFAYQLSPHNELARSWALFGQTAAALETATMTPAAWEVSLGCRLDEFLRIAFSGSAVAAAHSGWLDLEALAESGVRPYLGKLSVEQLLMVTRSRLSANRRAMRQDRGNMAVPNGLEKYRYNPIAARPYLELGPRLLAPVPHLAAQRSWPNSLYYDRVREPGFADDLGVVFEAYIGRQLKVLEDYGVARVVEKVIYDAAHGAKESVDWFVIFPRVLVLVEAKAGRLTAEARQGADRLIADVSRTLGRAYTQIGTTSDLLNSGHPEFSHLLSNLPRLGLAVTLEPYWLLWGDAQLPDSPDTVSVLPVSCGEIEGMVSAAIAGSIDDILLGLAAESVRSSRQFNNAFAGVQRVGNPVLDWAFAELLGDHS